jgi:NAD(P)-dependent dehydrogenase (short-subunit alcohol dehydrogenase family)
MSSRAALVTGGSSGIGLAIAKVLAEEGFALTLTARRPQKLAAAAADVRERGGEVIDVAGDVRSEDEIRAIVGAHRERFGRLDVLVNNVGLGIAGPIDGLQTKHLDLQFAVNLRSMILFYREAMPMLRAAGESGRALVLNTSSYAGHIGTGGLSVYSATKHGMVGFTQAMNDELRDARIRSCVLCPSYVDTPLSDFIKHEIPPEQMITVEDIAESVRYLLTLSPNCVVNELVFRRPADAVA